jgi:large repetitive protein
MLLRALLDVLKPNSSRTPVRPARSRLAVESLEDRRTPAAMLTIGDMAVAEGNAGTHNVAVTVNLTEPHGNSVTVNYKTVDGSAKAASDYKAASGTLTFPRGVNSKTVLVPVIGDRVPDADKAFFVDLFNGKGAKILDGEAVVSVSDDEPRVMINDAWADEGNDGTSPMRFTVNLSQPYDWPVSVDWSTADGSASAGSDYVAASGTVTFAPGDTSEPIDITMNGNRVPDANRTLMVNLSNPSSYAEISRGSAVGTIVDDEPRIYISDSYNYGEGWMTFTVTLSRAYGQQVTVNWSTGDGTATPGVDYEVSSGQVIFDPGVTSMTFMVQVLDATSAPDKWFTVHLSGATPNAEIATESATGYWYYDYGYYYDPGYDPYYGYYDYGYYW